MPEIRLPRCRRADLVRSLLKRRAAGGAAEKAVDGSLILRHQCARAHLWRERRLGLGCQATSLGVRVRRCLQSRIGAPELLLEPIQLLVAEQCPPIPAW